MALHLPDSPARVATVVACHGLNASRTATSTCCWARRCRPPASPLARFDFRGCGESSGVEEDTTIVSRMEDVEAVVAFLAQHPRLDGRVGLLGSSLGGFRRAAGRGAPLRAAATTGRHVERAGQPDRAGQRRPAREPRLGVPFALEYATGRYALAPTGLPLHLIVHGDADEVVSLEHGVALHERAAEPCDFVIIPGGDHRLTDPAHREHAVALSVEWFLRHLASRIPHDRTHAQEGTGEPY